MPVEHVVELPGDPLGGKSGAKRYAVLFVGKHSTADYPYQVANERIASEVGKALGLWVPDSVVYPVRDEPVFFAHFIDTPATIGGEAAPPTPTKAYELFISQPKHAHYCHGVVLFDLFVANNDRKADNVLLDGQERLWLVDQGNALFYRPYDWEGARHPAGIPRLEAVAANPACLFDRRYHFTSWLRDWALVDDWCDRISSLPEYQIHHIVESLPEELLTPPERQAVRDFLLHRRSQMGDLVAQLGQWFESLPVRPV